MFGLVPFTRRSNSLSRSDNFSDFSSLLDDFFNDSFFSSTISTSSYMRSDIKETENEYVIETEIPGADKKDIKLDLRDDVLTINYEKNEENKEERDNYLVRERRVGSYSRKFNVKGVKHEDVKAKYEDGILSISLTKNDKVIEEGRKIEIN